MNAVDTDDTSVLDFSAVLQAESNSSRRLFELFERMLPAHIQTFSKMHQLVGINGAVAPKRSVDRNTFSESPLVHVQNLEKRPVGGGM
ncbi:hypothetical protein H2203_006880 [Taxawa tesnikishii (nom. ined.)]|nr:hypothetical protein H2203_006880 [Dothideales sp. JES 119]